MTPIRFASMLTILAVSTACKDDKQPGFISNTDSVGGDAGATSTESTSGGTTSAAGGTTSAAGGTTSAAGGTTSAAGGTTMATTAANSGGSTSIATTTIARCTEATTGELLLEHTASTGQPNALVGATKITAGSVASFNASDLDLKFCFSVVGSATLTAVSGMTIDYAAISGGTVNYINLTSTPLSVEATGEKNRYCIVFDVGSAAGASGVSVSGAAAVTYNWRFNEKGLDVSVMFDPRAKNAPELKAVLSGKVAACQVLAP
jgi:hypothetical protein